jgi:hypothetical protein
MTSRPEPLVRFDEPFYKWLFIGVLLVNGIFSVTQAIRGNLGLAATSTNLVMLASLVYQPLRTQARQIRDLEQRLGEKAAAG